METIAAASRPRADAARVHNGVWYRRWYPFAQLGSCLLYHRITRDQTPAVGFRPTHGLSVHVDRFEEQVEYLSRVHHCLDLGTAMRLLKEGRLPTRSIIITFDDGYRDNLALALPVLERYGVPATIYVTTGFAEGRARAWWYEVEAILRERQGLTLEWNQKVYSYSLRSDEEKFQAVADLFPLIRGLNRENQAVFLEGLYNAAQMTRVPPPEFLNWQEIRELGRHPLITIGAHTEHHLMLRALTTREAKQELSAPKCALEAVLGRPVLHFAYPFGGSDAVGFREMRLVREAGYASACVTHLGHICVNCARTPYALPRITVDHSDTMLTLKRKLSGIDTFIYKHIKGCVVPIASAETGGLCGALLRFAAAFTRRLLVRRPAL